MIIVTCAICGNWIDAVEVFGVEQSFIDAVRVEEVCPCCQPEGAE